ncbi:MAG TPA: mechanosensitive ion channel domain-containing protein, partial [Candidatus Eisenbacteria bacterium]|nr:mechanosensitive ion channel domain-containing protein [Candidatus Eisenbacteria bacterium]
MMLAWTWPQWLEPDAQKVGVAAGRLALTVLGALIVQRLAFLIVRRVERWLGEATSASPQGVQRSRTLAQIARHSITTLLGVWVVMHGLEILGWDVKPLLVGASILGAALGFGAQFLVRDVIAGVFILVEDQFSVGDAVEVNGQVATVEGLTLRVTQLRDYQGRVLFVPNGEMKIVVNHSRGWNRAVVDLPLAANQDLGRAFEAAEAAAAQLNADPAFKDALLEPFAVQGLERLGPEGAVLRVVARAVSNADAGRAAREARRR